MPESGLVYAGRVADDFKLTSGTWVRVAALRSRVLAALGPEVRDIVLVGENRAHVAALVIPSETGEPTESVRAAVKRHLRRAAAAATGESQRISRFAFLTDPLTVDSGDLTDKGAVSQHNVARNHRDAVEALYAEHPAEAVVVVDEGQPAAPDQAVAPNQRG